MKHYTKLGLVIFALLLMFALNKRYSASRILRADTADLAPPVVQDIEPLH